MGAQHWRLNKCLQDAEGCVYRRADTNVISAKNEQYGLLPKYLSGYIFSDTGYAACGLDRARYALDRNDSKRPLVDVIDL